LLAFESELTTLLSDLWALNKSISNPYLRRDIGKALTQSVPKLGASTSNETKAAVFDLQQKGYHKLVKLPSGFDAAEARARLENCPLSNAQIMNYQMTLVERNHFLLKDRPKDVFLANYNVEDVIRCTPLVKLACDREIIGAIQAYLGCTPTISAFQIWHTFPGYVDIPAENFHRDRDCFRFIKLFAYLNDVDTTAGPHQYVQCSHSPEALQEFQRAKGMNIDLPRLFEGNSRNLKLAEIESLFGANVLTITGAAGTAFLEDTYGLHRGTRPTTSPREIFSVTYTGLPLRYANENDRKYEMSRSLSFVDAGIAEPSDLERYLLRYFLH
jgi:hypothetical protein